jgi:hypothetical protein
MAEVHITSEDDGNAGVEFIDGPSLREQRKIIEGSIRKSERERPGSTDASVEAAIAQFRQDNADLILEEVTQEKFPKN